ncbi:hypothetical protein HPP92_027561 [Vanilla planifolia]|uniref:E2 ubiquitin-conjugating enzyme n=2 Tax=Vanilla planifolia TaxID=51239 RepID=A0A835PBY7_VANPL|nr:hypothetical protein HPP92_027561 [Vanilla planifolia]
MSSPSKRREMDFMKLMMSDYKVETINDGMQEFYVEFHGPKDSLYQGGVWKVRVELPDAYPYKSPSIGFVTKIYHPNVDEMSGSVCLDVINQTWSPMFDLLNVFDVFLPQLLLYPNPSDPLNGEAAALMMRDRAGYEQKVKGNCWFVFDLHFFFHALVHTDQATILFLNINFCVISLFDSCKLFCGKGQASCIIEYMNELSSTSRFTSLWYC